MLAALDAFLLPAKRPTQNPKRDTMCCTPVVIAVNCRHNTAVPLVFFDDKWRFFCRMRQAVLRVRNKRSQPS
jgi:hypothetical protein